MPAYEVGLIATKIEQAPHVFPPSSSKMTTKLPLMAAQHNFIRFRDNPFRYWHHYSIKVAEQAPQLSATNEEELSDYGTPAQIKRDLYAALQGINRGIFGVPSAKKSEIVKLVELLESQNPTPEPTLCLEKVAGVWKLIFSTITILGSRRTKLGLRDFISLGDFFQSIDLVEVCMTLFYNARILQSITPKLNHKVKVFIPQNCVLTCPGFVVAMEGKAVNVIKFSARGLTLLSGQLTIEALFKCTSKSRVDIRYNKSMITPDQLMNVFRKNYDLLLGIFNPEGWLEITYVDDSLRIGRDDKGNIFILERAE